MVICFCKRVWGQYFVVEGEILFVYTDKLQLFELQYRISEYRIYTFWYKLSICYKILLLNFLYFWNYVGPGQNRFLAKENVRIESVWKFSLYNLPFSGLRALKAGCIDIRWRIWGKLTQKILFTRIPLFRRKKKVYRSHLSLVSKH